jgi:CTP:molybdopterin cytidylyltransferase MocA
MLGADGSRLPVIVLAAGRGKRMGGPKALMNVAGGPWWVVQSCRFDQAGVTPVWVLSPQVLREIGPELRIAADDQLILESDPDAPMFQSVRAGLRALHVRPPRGVYILPIDVPAPWKDVWQALAANGPVAVPTFRGENGHPVYLSWDFVKEHIPLDGPAHGRLDHIIGPYAKYVPVKNPDVTYNLNTPERVRAFEDEARSRTNGDALD